MTTSISLKNRVKAADPEKLDNLLIYLFATAVGFSIGLILSLLVAFVFFPVANLRIEANIQETLVTNSYTEYRELREEASIAQSKILGTPPIHQSEDFPDSIKMLTRENLKIDRYSIAIWTISLAIIGFTLVYIAVACFENDIPFVGSGTAPFITLMSTLAITFAAATCLFAYTRPLTTNDGAVNQELLAEIEADPMVADYLQQIDYADSLLENYLTALNQNDAERIDHYLALGIDRYISQDPIAQNLDRQYESLYYDN